jgi:hypothetical protein
MFIAPSETPPATARPAGAATLSETERMAVRVGLMDGNAALARSLRWGFFTLFIRERPQVLANRRLEALRTYAELARVLAPRPVPFTSLVQAGFSRSQISDLMQMILPASGIGMNAVTPALA